MSDRFFVDDFASERVELNDAESHHALRALRLEIGDSVILFDGKGREAQATIAELGKKRIWFQISCITERSRELPGDLVIASALPKAERQRFLIEKLTEIGVHRFIPLVTEYSVVRPGNQHLEKFQRYTIEACKQCRRNHLMAFESAGTLATVLRCFADYACFLLHPSGSSWSDMLWSSTHSELNFLKTLFLIGPEGGFADQELQVARENGCQIISLGQTILRIETAAIAIAANMATFLQRTDSD
ncbi:MAG TPA: RsmE family RNA methyltransferase [Pirellulaceae bacterium]|nr:RsmE family RNA methyltransferase [Pirellulaceae bacterium]HMO93724.1 RsmE family RNA methyltransferase [Pirellulaceae bacterium]HMP69773.1 RsmE family RNA methyltransferase [Pirellulaceae bacterium]